MHLIIGLIVFLGSIAIAALIVWMADWVSVGGRRRGKAVDILDRRLARGEIDKTEYDQKRKMIGR